MLRNTKDIENYSIGATDGNVGQVKDFYFDDHAWAIRYLVVDTGSWLSSRKVLISPISIHDPDWAARTLPVAITREQVRNSPDIDTDRLVSRQHEMQYLGYYGYSPYWGGTGLWGAGMYPYGMYSGRAGFGWDGAGREKVNDEYARAEQARHQDDDPNLRSCNAVIGYHIHATDGEIGHVQGMLIDENTWAYGTSSSTPAIGGSVTRYSSPRSGSRMCAGPINVFLSLLRSRVLAGSRDIQAPRPWHRTDDRRCRVE